MTDDDETDLQRAIRLGVISEREQLLAAGVRPTDIPEQVK